MAPSNEWRQEGEGPRLRHLAAEAVKPAIAFVGVG